MELSKKIRVALWWDRFRRNRRRMDHPVTISAEGRTINRLIICLPVNRQEYDFSKRFIKSLENALGPFPSMLLKYMGSTEARAGMGLEMRDDFLLYTTQDLNRLGLPSKALSDQAAQLQADALVDLNTEFSPVIASLVAVIPAALKVGFYSERGEYYYNILVRKKGTDLMDSGFKELHQLLGI